MEEVKNQDPVKQCVSEVESILEKYKCRIVVQEREYYGQIVYVPVFVETQDKK